MCEARGNLGVVVGLSDTWRKGEIHHVKVCWLDLSSVWVPVEELEILSKKS
jgi:hypothetical protein